MISNIFDQAVGDDLFQSQLFLEEDEQPNSDKDYNDILKEFKFMEDNQSLHVGFENQMNLSDTIPDTTDKKQLKPIVPKRTKQSNNIDEYDVFQSLLSRTSKIVRTQSKMRMSRKDSDDQLSITFEGNTFWQKQSQSILGTYLSEIIESLQDLIKMMKHLLQMSNDDIYERINKTIKYLTGLDLQLKIVEEILLRCTEFPSENLSFLKKEMRKLTSVTIRAQKSNEVNMIMISSIRDYLVDDLVPFLLNAAQKCLFNDVASDLVQLDADLSQINSRLKMINILFPSAVDLSKTDLLSLDKNHQSWKQIYSVTTMKKLGDPENIRKSFDNFCKSILLGHALIQQKNSFSNNMLRKLTVFFGGLYYLILESKAKNQAMTHISEIKINSAIEVMNIIDQPGIKNLMAIALPSIGYNKKVYINPFVLPITLENINKEMDQGTISQITPLNLLMVNQELHNQESYKKEIFIQSGCKLCIRILCPDSPELVDETAFDILSENFDWKYLKSLWKGEQTDRNPKKVYETVIIHIHGGGFISQSSATHQCHTREWAIKLGVPIFSIDYGLSPKNPYPLALDDCWQAYHWIINQGPKYFNINPRTVIVCGDSAGGNITVSLTGLLVKYGQRIPDGIMVAYPAADLRLSYFPSVLYSLNDKLLSHTILGVCIHSYVANPQSRIDQDPFINPILLSDEIFSKFPPTRIVCGTQDPLLDQSWKLCSRLLYYYLNAGVDVKTTIYEGISHGFLNFKTINGMKEIDICIDDACNYLKELIELKANKKIEI